MSLMIRNSIVFNTLTAEQLPGHGAPVVIRLKNACAIAPPKEKVEDRCRELLEVGHRYGYAIAGMEYKRDGFGTKHPWCFRKLDLTGTVAPAVDKSIPLIEVDAWAYPNAE